MPRKTIEVNTVLTMANNLLALPTSSPDERTGVIVMLEGVLFASGQYGGFRYLSTDEVEGSGTRREYFMKAS